MPPAPHYHVVSAGHAEVWTSGSAFFIRQIGRVIRSGGERVDYFSCPVGTVCPTEVVYRWETGRAPTRERPNYGRRRIEQRRSKLKKSLAHEYRTMGV